MRRSEERRDLTVTHDVMLARGDDWVEVSTTVDNTVEDHRLRLRLSTGIEGSAYFASQPFCFVERAAGYDPATELWEERELLEKQTSGIVYKKNEQGGLAFLSAYGLHECGVTPSGDMYLTLLRAFARVERADGVRDGQSPGRMEYRYILMPTAADTPLAALQRRQDFLAACALRIDGDDALLYSTFTPAHGARELRVYNCSGETAQAAVSGCVLEGVESVDLVSLDGEKTGELPVRDGAFRLRAGAWEIVTVQF